MKINGDGSVGGILVSDGKPLSFTYKVGHNSTIDDSGNVYTVGNFYSRIVIGCDTLLSAGDEMFVLKHSHLPPVYSLDIDGPAVACDGTGIKLSIAPIPDPVKYFWTIPSPVQPTKVAGNEMEFQASSLADRAEINIRIRKGCETYESIEPYVVKLKYKPPAGIVAGDQLYCNPTTTRFLTTRYDEATSYWWTLPDGIEPRGTGLETIEPYIDVEITNSFSQGKIEARVVNECFETEASALPVRLVEKPGTIEFINSIPEICFTGPALQFTVAASQGADRYKWDISTNFDDAGTITTTQPKIELSVRELGAATIKATAQNDCHDGEATTYSFVLLKGPGTPAISAAPCDREVTTDATENILWFRNGTPLAKDVSTLKLTEDGDYFVTASNGCGTALSETLALFPLSLETLVVPNVITPNHDDKNDYLITTPRIEGLRVTVFNRWGSRVFDTPNYTHDWDGGDLTAGTYFIEVRHQCIEKVMRGTLQVVK